MKKKLPGILKTVLPIIALIIVLFFFGVVSGILSNPFVDSFETDSPAAQTNQDTSPSLTTDLQPPSQPVQTQQTADITDNSREIVDISEGGEWPEGSLLVVHYIDVGQADCAFIEFPDGKCMLIDGGNQADGTNVVEYISGLGYDTIDAIVASHPHEDHIGGLPAILTTFTVSEIYMPEKDASSKIYKKLMETVDSEGVTLTYVSGQMSIYNAGGVSAITLGPNNSYDDPNDNSIIVKLIYDETTFLFTGDATTLAESDAIGDVSATVLKVGHHGSKTSCSDSFLKRVWPAIAVISVGEDNEYGHPAQEILDRLSGYVQTIYRTDIDGTIVIISNGEELKCYKSK